MKQKTAYVAGKIGDLEPKVYLDKFVTAAVEIEFLGFKAVLPTELPHNHDKSWESHMKEDLHALLDCDIVYAQHDWRSSKGATIEVNLALQLGKPVLYQVMFEKMKSSNIDFSKLSNQEIKSYHEQYRREDFFKIKKETEHLLSLPLIPKTAPICDDCGGTGANGALECFHCNGTGYVNGDYDGTLLNKKLLEDRGTQKFSELSLTISSDQWVKADRPWSAYPIGTKASAVMGGYWYKVQRGWKWNGPDGNGGVFPNPGGDAAGDVIVPEEKLLAEIDYPWANLKNLETMLEEYTFLQGPVRVPVKIRGQANYKAMIDSIIKSDYWLVGPYNEYLYTRCRFAVIVITE